MLMPRYYFDIKDDDDVTIDDRGVDLPDLDAAIAEARQALADMVGEALQQKDHDEMAVRIRDAIDGAVLMEVTVQTDIADTKQEQA